MAKEKKRHISKAAMKVIERIDEAIRNKAGEDGDFKIKKGMNHKKKVERYIQYACPHWRIKGKNEPGVSNGNRENRLGPAIKSIPGRPDMIKCRICGAEFPRLLKNIDPQNPNVGPYDAQIDQMLATIHALKFYGINYGGGDAEDNKRFFRLTHDLIKLKKVSKNIVKCNMRQKAVENMQNGDDSHTEAYGTIEFPVP